MIVFYTIDKGEHALSALASIISLRRHAGIHKDSPVICAWVQRMLPKYVEQMDKLGSVSHIVTPRFQGHGWSNKLLSSEIIGRSNLDCMLSLDCDMIICGELEAYLTPGCFNSRVAGKYSMPRNLLQNMFNAFGIKWPKEEPYIMGNGGNSIFYPAIGVVHAPAKTFKNVMGLAAKYARIILDQNMNQGLKFVGQSAVTCALHELGTKVHPLPDEMAFHMGRNVPEPLLKKECEPSIMHTSVWNNDIVNHPKCRGMPNVLPRAKRALDCMLEARRIMGHK